MTKTSLHRTTLLTAWVLGALFVSLNLLLGILYQDRIYPGIQVGATKVGGMTRQEAREALGHQISAFHIALTVDSQRYDLKPSQLGAEYDIPMTVENAYGLGRDRVLPLLGMLSALAPRPVLFVYALDHQELSGFIAKLSTSQAQAPVDATVIVDNGIPRVTPDKNGLGIDKAKVAEAIRAGIDQQSEQVVVERAPIAADVRALQAGVAADQAKKLVAQHLVLTYQDKRFSPTAAQIGSWLTFTKPETGDQLQVGADRSRVKTYIDSFAGNVEVAALPKKIEAVNGVVKQSDGGVDGLAINRDQLAGQIAGALLAGSTAPIVVPTVAVAFKTIYNNSISLDAPKYIEVNLSLQHLWAYQDHQVVFESPVTSGATGAGFPTVQGLFSVYAKERNRYLDGRPLGYNYNVFVKYWMPFYADYGLHDASWRSQFGGSDYYYNGSHGCINLPEATAAWLWNWDEIGTPVWVHG